MNLTRPMYLEPGFPTFSDTSSFGSIPFTVPKFDTPITPKENFWRAARRDKPLWVPNAHTDQQMLHINELGVHKPGKMQFGPDFRAMQSEDYTFIDPFGNSWTWVASAGGAMLTPGTKVVEDICDWEKHVKWPNLEEWTVRETAAKFMAERYDPDKILHINIHQGLTELLVAMVGGYGEGMLAMAEEPEACSDYFNRLADFIISFFDYLKALYPVEFVTYHDDWGTERETFFGERMMEELVYEPTKRIIDHIKGAGCIFELHSCGKIERFLPYMCNLGVDFLQIQRRAVDIPKMKELYGDRIGFNAQLEGYDFGIAYSDTQITDIVRQSVELYGKGGGFYPAIFESDPERLWKLCSELYCYSREYYSRF
ncbi:MAG: hypothetical protein LBO63_06705 [Oscillospiraceae bacterium]|jgi:hypothetical protein|nr:hypothetical protein [Oscillospiraceae bacterium]